MGKLYLITGNDQSGIEEDAKKLMAKMLGDDYDEFSHEVFKESDDLQGAELLKRVIESLQTPSFLGGDKTIWLQNFSGFDQEPAKSTKNPNDTGKALLALADYITESFPDDVSLLISGPGVDSRKRLFKACEKIGKTKVIKKPELNSRQWRQEVQGIMNKYAQGLEMNLDRHTLDYLTEVIGVDTGRIPMELEKIYCYAGTNPRLEDVQRVSSGQREAVFYALNNGWGDRNLKACMEAITQTMVNSKDEDGECIRLIRMSATFFRKLLHAKVAMRLLRCRSADQLSSRLGNITEEEQQKVGENLLFGMSSWQAKILASQSMNYRPDDLRNAIHILSEADQSMVSTSLPKRLLMETLVLRIINHKAA